MPETHKIPFGSSRTVFMVLPGPLYLVCLPDLTSTFTSVPPSSTTHAETPSCVICTGARAHAGRLALPQIFLQLSRLRIQSADAVHCPEIRAPDVAVLVRIRVPRHAARRHFVHDVHNLQRFIAELLHPIHVTGKIRRRFRKRARPGAENLGGIGREFVDVLIVLDRAVDDAAADSRGHHVLESFAPSGLVAPHVDELLKPVAARAAVCEFILAGPFRKQVDALNDRNFVPVHHLLLQRPVERGVLIRGENDSALRVGPVTHGFRQHLIIAGRADFPPGTSRRCRKALSPSPGSSHSEPARTRRETARRPAR